MGKLVQNDNNMYNENAFFYFYKMSFDHVPQVSEMPLTTRNGISKFSKVSSPKL